MIALVLMACGGRPPELVAPLDLTFSGASGEVIEGENKTARSHEGKHEQQLEDQDGQEGDFSHSSASPRKTQLKASKTAPYVETVEKLQLRER